jgi:hypothetical protein
VTTELDLGGERPDDSESGFPKGVYWTIAVIVSLSALIVGALTWWVYRSPEITPERQSACAVYRDAEDGRWDAKEEFANGSMARVTFLAVADRSSLALEAVLETGIDWKDCPQF